jgi:predicted acylesterase/phospholipase RssA
MRSSCQRATLRVVRALLVAVALAAAVAGCAVLPRNPVPLDSIGEAVIPGMSDVRAWAGTPSPVMERDILDSFAQESRAAFPVAADGKIHYAHLALSGGGPNGAFGAGFLKGWTETGRRPIFKIVTGVSTGALIAPYAMLGPEYDEAVRKFYTTTSSRNIFQRLAILPQLLAGESLADTGPLARIIESNVDAQFLANVAAAHDRGQRLYLGTVDLDAQRFMVWNMGLIAKRGNGQALDLFRRVMLASSSVPVAFPPVYFDVVVDGRKYDEMHVDGSVATRVFYNGGLFNLSAVSAKAGLGPVAEDAFVIHNGQLLPVPEATPRTLRAIGMRSFETAGKAALIGDLFRIYAVTRSEGAGFHWVTIPDGFDLSGNEVFDPVTMSALFELGYEVARKGPEWAPRPPGLDAWEAQTGVGGGAATR